MRRPTLILVGVLCAALPACKTGGAASPNVDIPPYPDIAAAHNGRAEQLDRLWARCIVALRYQDSDGQRRYEQGDGYLQRLDADKLALSVGKLGETLFWFGADDERYWLFDLSRSGGTVAFVGRHDALTPEKATRAGLPIPPRQLLTLAGLTPLPESAARAPDAHDGAIRATVRHDGLDWRYTLDPTTLLPSAVELLDAAGTPVIASDLSKYGSVDITGRGVDRPQAPSRIAITELDTDSSITIVIDGDIIDGRRAAKPKPNVFDFEFLVDALAPGEVVDLDRSAETAQAP